MTGEDVVVILLRILLHVGNSVTTDLITRCPYSHTDKRCANDVKHSAMLLGSVFRGRQDGKTRSECD